MPKVKITDQHNRETVLDLEPGSRFRIGRDSKNEVVLADPSLSRTHAEIYEEAGAIMLSDSASKNGVFVNNRRISAPVTLEPGMRVTLGTCKLSLVGAGDDFAVSGAVTFEDRPLPPQGTVVMQVADVLQVPTAAARDEKSFKAELEKFRTRFSIVERANLELLAHEPMDVLLPKILDQVFEAVKPERVALLRRVDGALVCRAYRGKDGQEMTVSRTIANTVIDQRVSVLTADAQVDERFAAGASIMSEGIQAVMAVPLWNNKEVIGLIYADSRMSSGLFNDEDLRVLTMLANIAAIQIENTSLFAEQLEKKRFETEAKAAAAVQQRLLPLNKPEIPGYVFEWHNTPCYECGGDYYDCLDLGEKRAGIVLADVAGKGMGAAMLMAVIQATLQARADTGSSPEELVSRLGDAISRSAPSNRYATLFFADLDYEAHRMRFVNAGHAPPPLLIRASGELRKLKAGGTPLGLFPGTRYPVEELELGRGDLLFACTDGVTDLEDPDGEMFGEERLLDLMRSLAGHPCEEVRSTLDRELESFAKKARQTDDLTYIILQRTA